MQTVLKILLFWKLLVDARFNDIDFPRKDQFRDRMCLCGALRLCFRHSWQKMIITLIFFSCFFLLVHTLWTPCLCCLVGFIGWWQFSAESAWNFALSGVRSEFAPHAWTVPNSTTPLYFERCYSGLANGETRQEMHLLFLQRWQNVHTKFGHWSALFYKAARATIDSSTHRHTLFLLFCTLKSYTATL